MRDAQPVEEIIQHRLLRAEQPRLEQMRRERVADRTGECILHPWMSLVRRLPLDEDGPQIALVRESLNGRFVDRLLFLVQEAKDLGRSLRRHALEKFVRSHEGL